MKFRPPQILLLFAVFIIAGTCKTVYGSFDNSFNSFNSFNNGFNNNFNNGSNNNFNNGSNNDFTNNGEYSIKREVLSQFDTKFNKNSKSRTHNLKLCSVAIDQYEIKPGEIFSFNQVVGYAGPQQGYEKAVIFVDGKEVKAYGGGICQVSSTLYNAAMEAGLEIIERHPHSKEVKYVEKGKDAATSYGSVDLKFKNNNHFPVIINTYISDEIFTVEILK